MVYTLCIGSNWQRAQNMALARCRLTALFPDIRFSEEMETAPLKFTRPDCFSNQVARFTSSYCATDIKKLLKAIEQEAGRLPEDKANEIVKLDIDLLMGDEVVFKAEDVQRDYVKAGIAALTADFSMVSE